MDLIDKTCSICTENINNNIKTLNCKHSYHLECINKWLIIINTCPLCRQIVIDEIKILNNNNIVINNKIKDILYLFIISLLIICIIWNIIVYDSINKYIQDDITSYISVYYAFSIFLVFIGLYTKNIRCCYIFLFLSTIIYLYVIISELYRIINLIDIVIPFNSKLFILYNIIVSILYPIISLFIIGVT